MDRVAAIAHEGLKKDIPMFAAGDTLRGMDRVREGDKERLQAFEGVCVSRRGGGIEGTFAARKLSAGVGVERIFPMHAPTSSASELVRRGNVRRAKLYYLRAPTGKGARIKEKKQPEPEDPAMSRPPSLARERLAW